MPGISRAALLAEDGPDRPQTEPELGADFQALEQFHGAGGELAGSERLGDHGQNDQGGGQSVIVLEVAGGALGVDDDDVMAAVGHDGGGKGTGETEHAVGAGGELVLESALRNIAEDDVQAVDLGVRDAFLGDGPVVDDVGEAFGGGLVSEGGGTWRGRAGYWRR